VRIKSVRIIITAIILINCQAILNKFLITLAKGKRSRMNWRTAQERLGT